MKKKKKERKVARTVRFVIDRTEIERGKNRNKSNGKEDET